MSASPLREIAAVFLRLGVTSFGGPAAHLAMMEEELVRRRAWVTPGEFLDLVSAANLVPGPNSTEVALHLGLRRGGWRGFLLAGACFILPSTLFVAALAALYVRFGSLPAASGLLRGMKPVLLAIVLTALVSLGRTALKSLPLTLLAGAALAAALLGANELVILGAAGLLSLALTLPGRRAVAALAGLLLPGAAGAAATVPASPTLPALFLFFLKVGSVLFGSGYVLLAFLRAELVARHAWITDAQLLDAIAVGQFTPGPVFTTATFVGWLLRGPAGAALATAGIFLPAFVFVAVSGPLVPRLRRSPRAGAVLDGVNAASLALMAAVSVLLARSAVTDVPSAVLFAGSAFLLLRRRVASVWLLLIGAAAGLALAGS